MSIISRTSSTDLRLQEANMKFDMLRQLLEWGEISEEDYKARHTQIDYQLTETESFFEAAVSRMSYPTLPRISNTERWSIDIASTSGQSTLDQIKKHPPPDWDEMPLERGLKIIWNTSTKSWQKEKIKIKLDDRRSFAKGSFREVYHLWDETDPYQKYVAKFSMDVRDQQSKQIYFQDVKAQAIANQLAKLYNSQSPPKKVEFIHAYVLVLLDRNNTLCGVERFIPGIYFKYNDNTFWENELHRNTPAAFSHFTYEVSHHEILVCDIQGVGDCYTDPQVHSVFGGTAFGKGDRGAAGIRDFLSTHKCNKVCQYLNLPNVLGAKIKIGGTLPSQPNLVQSNQNCIFEGHKDGERTPLLRDGSIDNIDWIPNIRKGSIFNHKFETERDACCICWKLF